MLLSVQLDGERLVTLEKLNFGFCARGVVWCFLQDIQKLKEDKKREQDI